MDLATYRELHAQARRLTRRAIEADDLVQDVLLAALEATARHRLDFVDPDRNMLSLYQPADAPRRK
jgi:DNA-directed RNA polymerase specialized sigma24 family protein